jgi:hypothetical protein
VFPSARSLVVIYNFDVGVISSLQWRVCCVIIVKYAAV